VLSARTAPVRPRRIWWRGLTDTGAASGVPTGGGAAMAAVLVTVFGPTLSGWQTELLAQPAVWTVPLAFTVMVAGSLLTRGRVPADVGATMLAAARPGSRVKEALRNACSAS
jgi:cation/acetate symporter